MPPTDIRLLAYTLDEMYLEYVADAIEDERIELGVDGMPAKRVMYKGEEITQTGSELFDRLEREWIDQDDYVLDQDEDILQELSSRETIPDVDEEIENGRS